MKPIWTPLYVSGICIGIQEIKDGFNEVVFNTILPDTDEGYEQQKQAIEERVNLICDLYNNLNNGLSFVNY